MGKWGCCSCGKVSHRIKECPYAIKGNRDSHPKLRLLVQLLSQAAQFLCRAHISVLMMKVLGTKVKLSTAFYSQTDGQVERTIQKLEDMLRACVLDFKGRWDDHLPLIKFAYNKSYHASIQMAPFDALYGRRCRSPIGWFEVGEAALIGIDFVLKAMAKCSYANIVPSTEEFEKLDLPRPSFAYDHPSTSSMPSSIENPDQRSYRVNLPQVTKDHDNFDDFRRKSDSKEQRKIQNAKEKQTVDTEEKSKMDTDSTCINRKELLVKMDLDSLESEIKIYVKTYIDQKFKDLERVMNDKFSKVLKLLQQKNETVEKKNILKQSWQEGDPSDDVVDVPEPTTNSLVKETDKLVKMEEDKANQAPSPFNNGEQHEKDDGIEKLSDIVVEEMQPLDSIILGEEHDMTLIIYKPPPASADETDEIADMEMSLINTIKELSTRLGQPWHLVNEVFVPINCDSAFHWVFAVIASKDRCICVYDSMASSRK
ncbi:hypothetical protein CQW23_23935 [Capsicum baccatum]|uniref:Ubiquitin-like protease family profile domain-containing protein n=1 Tax=Capsicum baccatum TaxID=33114 RepID=A0A2G2VTD6_CAPBA|nr:hypothetical protein CQW23_23935 [Capsicum baccatum]